jgi:hypothetical protein
LSLFFLAKPLSKGGQSREISNALQKLTTESTDYIPASLLVLILNRYIYSNKEPADKFTKYTFPSYETVDGDNHTFSSDTTKFKISNAIYNALFSFLTDPSVVTSTELSWNSEEWFDQELSPWFDSIASTLSASARAKPASQ